MISTLAFIGLCNVASAVEVYAPSSGHATNPKWSSDGSKVAFEINELSGKIDLMVSNIGEGLTAGSTKQIRLNVGSSIFGGSLWRRHLQFGIQRLLTFSGLYRWFKSHLHV